MAAGASPVSPIAAKPAPSAELDSPATTIGTTASPTTNGFDSSVQQHNGSHRDNVAAGNAPSAEQPDHASPDIKKRSQPETSSKEEPKPKRARTSPTSPSTDCTKDQSIRPEAPSPVNKETWQGFCEIESEPAFFSAILRDLGVRGINVREVVTFDSWFIETLPEPVHGLILLYRYRDQGSYDPPTKGHSDMWFANQLPAQNSCATLAMINVIMNNPNIEIGEHLQQFKDFTKDFTPYQRGEAFANFDFVKKIHNSFAKHMDMLEADKHLSYKVNKAQRLLKDKKTRRKSTDSAATDDSAADYEENAHHFIAYIPVGNEVWMLDGLNAQPISVATFEPQRGETWLTTAADTIQALIAGEEYQYTSFAVTQSPLPSLRKQACNALNHIKRTETRLDEVSINWKSFAVGEVSPPHPAMLGIEEELSAHPVPITLVAAIAEEETRDLLERRSRVLKDLDQLATNIVMEMQNEAEEIHKAEQRRFDCGPVIKLWAEMLASNGWLEQNLDRFMEDKKKIKQ